MSIVTVCYAVYVSSFLLPLIPVVGTAHFRQRVSLITE